MAAINFPYIRFSVLKAESLKHLFEQLSDEPRPFELVVHPPIAGTRPVTIKASCKEDAQYFSGILKTLSCNSQVRIAHGTDKVKS